MVNIFRFLVLFVFLSAASSGILSAQRTIYDLPAKKGDVEKEMVKINRPLEDLRKYIDFLGEKKKNLRMPVATDAVSSELARVNQSLADLANKINLAENSKSALAKDLESTDRFARWELDGKIKRQEKILSDLEKEKLGLLDQKQKISEAIEISGKALSDSRELDKKIEEAIRQKTQIELENKEKILILRKWENILEIAERDKYIVTNSEVSAGIGEIATVLPSPPVKNILGANTQTYFIYAISSIIAEQFKADLTELYLSRLKKIIDENALAKTFFQNTLETFKPEEIFYYEELGTSWKKAFENDLHMFPDRLFEYIAQNNSDDPLVAYAILANKIIGNFRDNEPLFKKLKTLSEDKDPIFAKVEGLLPTLKLIIWLQEKIVSFESAKEFWGIFNDDLKTQLFLNEMFAGNREYFASAKMNDENAIQENIGNIRRRIIAIYYNIERIVAIVDAERVNKSEAIEIIGLSGQLIQNALRLCLRERRGEISPGEGLSEQQRLEIEKKNAEIKRSNAEIEKVETAISVFENVFEIYQTVCEQNYYHSIEKAFAFLEKIKIIQPNDKALQVLLKYGPFIEGIAAAKNPDDIKRVLSQVLLPRYSALLKRKTDFSITISAHPGFYSGWENSKPINEKSIQGLTFGFTAPVGVEFCFGKTNGVHRSKAWMLSIIDPGAVVSFLAKKSSYDYAGLPQDMTFQQIFAPGVFYFWGFKDSPLCVFIGAQFLPELRKIMEGDVVKNRARSARIILGISWDIALLGIHPKMN